MEIMKNIKKNLKIMFFLSFIGLNNHVFGMFSGSQPPPESPRRSSFLPRPETPNFSPIDPDDSEPCTPEEFFSPPTPDTPPRPPKRRRTVSNISIIEMQRNFERMVLEAEMEDTVIKQIIDEVMKKVKEHKEIKQALGKVTERSGGTRVSAFYDRGGEEEEACDPDVDCVEIQVLLARIERHLKKLQEKGEKPKFPTGPFLDEDGRIRFNPRVI